MKSSKYILTRIYTIYSMNKRKMYCFVLFFVPYVVVARCKNIILYNYNNIVIYVIYTPLRVFIILYNKGARSRVQQILVNYKTAEILQLGLRMIIIR